MGTMGRLARTLAALSGKESVHGIIPSLMLGLERPGKDENQKKLPINWSHRMGIGSSSQKRKDSSTRGAVWACHYGKRFAGPEEEDGGAGQGRVGNEADAWV